MQTRLVGFAGAFAILAFVAGCGKELGRVQLTGEGTGKTTAQVTAGKPLVLWTALDVKWQGDDSIFDAFYDVELEQGGAVVAKATCNPFDVNVKTSSKTINVGGSHSIAYNGKMHCDLMPTKTGPATVKATLRYTAHPTTLVVKNMSLVVKE